MLSCISHADGRRAPLRVVRDQIGGKVLDSPRILVNAWTYCGVRTTQVVMKVDYSSLELLAELLKIASLLTYHYVASSH